MGSTTKPRSASRGDEREPWEKTPTTETTSAAHMTSPGHGEGHRRRWIVAAGVAVVVLVVAVIAGVATWGDDETSTSGTSTTEAPSATETAPRTAAPAPARAPAPVVPAPGPSDDGAVLLEDGRHAAMITGLDVEGRAVEVDVVQFLMGDEATAAYREDHPDDPTGSPDNDYYIVNDNPRLRTLPVVNDVVVTVVSTGTSANDPHTIAFEDLPGYFATYEGAGGQIWYNPFWLTVDDDRIVALDEQYTP